MAAIFYAFSTLKAKLGDKERGATAVEYGIMVALIAVVIITAVILVGDNLTAVFNDVGDKLELAEGSGGGTTE